MRSDKHAPAACTAIAAVPAVLGGKHDSRIARRRGSTGPNAREPRGSCGVPGGGRPPDPGKPQPPRRTRRIEPGHVTDTRTPATAYDTSRVCSRYGIGSQGASNRSNPPRLVPSRPEGIYPHRRGTARAHHRRRTRTRSCNALDHPPLRGPRRGPPDRGSCTACPSGCRARIPGPRTRLPRLQ